MTFYQIINKKVNLTS